MESLQNYHIEKEVGHTTETAQSMSSTYGEGEAGMSLLPELAYEDNEGSAKVIKAVQEGNLAVLQEFEAYFKSKGFDFKHFPVNPLIIIAVFGSPEAVEHVQSWSSTTFNWNDQLEIPVGVFEGLLDEMKDRKATSLFVATFLKKPVIVESLIKYSDEQNIAYCMNNIQLSNPMEIFFMAEVGERLKKEYRELKPSVVPGHQREANGRLARVFIVYSPKVVHVTNHIKDGIGLVMIRNPYRVDDEAMTVSNSKEVDGDSSKQDMERTNKAIESHSKTLWCNHSNLNIISVCTVRSKRKGGALEKCLCVVLYCSTKGVVPLGEKEFPSTLALGEDDSIDIDVREGYFEFGGYPTKPSTNHHDKLKMGCNIGALPSQNGWGTLGPFVQYKGTMGFLTCAHVLFDVAHQHSVDFTDNGSNQRLVVQPATDASSKSGNPCGFVHRVNFNPSMDISIDVAVVTISDETRRPNKGRFANDHSYKYREAGFDDLPEYNNGAILPDIKKFGTSNFVVKFGSETHLTKGYLRVDGAQVRPLSTALGLPSMKAKFYMKNQYEIIGDKSGINIFQPGDSGSAVFMLEGTSLHCIGLAIGRTTHGTAVVTPIQAILAALGSDADIEIQRFNEL
ncbi:hypothetical protein KP79_PYT22781 [Mizuhopecten yessoensis]|uniref:Uncharacterized protein n=1 Tax=Mizuhopecten yessoensis TaxID=6573 RepID=A0A210QPF4_MIZYE|nr:hypothetical protein KP79_PYT22781 [Mizuhopecten yessoensis]